MWRYDEVTDCSQAWNTSLKTPPASQRFHHGHLTACLIVIGICQPGRVNIVHKATPQTSIICRLIDVGLSQNLKSHTVQRCIIFRIEKAMVRVSPFQQTCVGFKCGKQCHLPHHSKRPTVCGHHSATTAVSVNVQAAANRFGMTTSMSPAWCILMTVDP